MQAYHGGSLHGKDHQKIMENADIYIICSPLVLVVCGLFEEKRVMSLLGSGPTPKSSATTSIDDTLHPNNLLYRH
jgi:hypothetical protein